MASLREGAAGALLCVTNFLVVFDGLVVTLALLPIEDELGMSSLDGQWVITIYALAFGGLLLLGGRCGDRFGLRPTLITGLALIAVGLLAAGWSDMAWMLLTARGVQGAGAALAVPTTFAMISRMPDGRRRHRLFAAVAVAGGLGAAGGAIIGGLITEGLGWRFVFFLAAPVAAVAALAAPGVLSSAPRTGKPGSLDAPAGLLAVTALALVIFAITGIDRNGLWSIPTLASFTLSLLLAGAFVRREAHVETPLLRPELLGRRSLRAAVGGIPGQEFAYQGTVFAGLLFLQQVMGYGPVTAGLAFSPLGASVLLGSPLANRLLRRVHWTLVVAAAQLMCAGALFVLASATPASSYPGHLLPSLLLLGLANSVSAVTFNVVAGRDVTESDKGVAYGLYETSKYLAGTLAVACIATIVSSQADQPGGVAAGYELAFTAAAFVALAGGALAVMLDPFWHRTKEMTT